MIYLFLAAAFVIHSTSVFVLNFLSLPSEIIVFFRAALGFAVCVLFLLFTKRKTDKNAVFQSLKFIVLSSISLLFSWNFLYKAFLSSTLAFSLLVFSAFFPLLYAISRKTDKTKRVLTIVFCVAGEIAILLFSAIGKDRVYAFLMALLSVVSALLSVVFDRRVKKISFVENLSVKFFIIAVLSGLYGFLFVPVTSLDMGMRAFLLLIVLGVVHTGIFYFLVTCFSRRAKHKTLSKLTLISPALSLVFCFILNASSFEVLFLVPFVLILVLPFAVTMR